MQLMRFDFISKYKPWPPELTELMKDYFAIPKKAIATGGDHTGYFVFLQLIVKEEVTLCNLRFNEGEGGYCLGQLFYARNSVITHDGDDDDDNKGHWTLWVDIKHSQGLFHDHRILETILGARKC